MAERKPLVLIDGVQKQLPDGDTVAGVPSANNYAGVFHVFTGESVTVPAGRESYTTENVLTVDGTLTVNGKVTIDG